MRYPEIAASSPPGACLLTAFAIGHLRPLLTPARPRLRSDRSDPSVRVVGERRQHVAEGELTLASALAPHPSQVAQIAHRIPTEHSQEQLT